jgi:hypothetical protein
MQQGPAASSGSNPKAPGSAGGYLLSHHMSTATEISEQFYTDPGGLSFYYNILVTVRTDESKAVFICGASRP